MEHHKLLHDSTVLKFFDKKMDWYQLFIEWKIFSQQQYDV